MFNSKLNRRFSRDFSRLSAFFLATGVASTGLWADTYSISGNISGDISSLIANADSITVAAGTTATLQANANASAGNLDWYVENGASLNVVNESQLGTGTVYLQNGATLAASGSVRSVFSNPINVAGTVTLSSAAPGLNLTGTITGDSSAVVKRTGGYCLNIESSNPDYHGSWILDADYLAIKQNDSLGDGVVYFNNGALIVNTNKLTIANDLVINRDKTYLTAGQSTVTLTGKITGSKNIVIASNQYFVTNCTHLQGDASEFTGNWTINEGKGNTKTTKATVTVTTNNTNPVKNSTTNADDRFGSGSITIGNGILGVGHDVSAAYVHNNINLIAYDKYENDALVETVATLSPFSFDGKQLFLTGNLSGSANISISNATQPSANSTTSRLYLFGDNSNFSGNWELTNAFLATNAGNVKNKAFGSGTIYLNGGSGIVGWSSNSTADNAQLNKRDDAYVFNDLVNSGVNFFVSTGDAIPETGQCPNFELNIQGNISGDGVLVRKGGGYCMTIGGNNAQYSGDWIVADDYVKTQNATETAGNDAATHTDARLGSGTVYLSGGGIQSALNVFCNVTINDGKTGYFRYGTTTLWGTTSVDGTLATATQLNIAGTLQGTGTIQGQGEKNGNGEIKILAGGILAPGSEGVFAYDGNYVKSAVADSSIGTLTVSNTLTMDSDAILDMDVASWGNSDKLVISENLSLDGVQIALNFADSIDFKSVGYQDYLDLDLISGAEVSGVPTLVYDESINSLFSYPTAYLTAVVADGKLLVMASGDPNAVPEPGALTLCLIGLGLGAFCLRKRRA